MCRFFIFKLLIKVFNIKPKPKSDEHLNAKTKNHFFFFCFLYRHIADIERNWSVADETAYVSSSDSQSDAQIIIASSSIINTTTTTTVPTTTTTSQNDAGRNENANTDYSGGDVSSIEINQHDALQSSGGVISNSIDSSDNA